MGHMGYPVVVMMCTYTCHMHPREVISEVTCDLVWDSIWALIWPYLGPYGPRALFIWAFTRGPGPI